jgi:hypothetical protein
MIERIIRKAVPFFFVIACLLGSAVFAHAVEFTSPNLGGATGLFTTPTARTGWEGNRMGLDTGIGFTNLGDGSTIPKATLQLFDNWELGLSREMQGEDDSDDLLLHTKLCFSPWTRKLQNTALAVGINYMDLEINNQGYTNYQLYFAATYKGVFFDTPAETTLVFGKTMGDDELADDDNWDFSMGFDMDFFRDALDGYVHWICEFSNYSYTVDPYRNTTLNRGSFNTGFRIAALKDHPRYKLNFDLMYLDLLDADREFGAAVAFGIKL